MCIRDSLACGIVNAINIFQPDVLCIGGGISREGETLLSPLRTLVAVSYTHLWPFSSTETISRSPSAGMMEPSAAGMSSFA